MNLPKFDVSCRIWNSVKQRDVGLWCWRRVRHHPLVPGTWNLLNVTRRKKVSVQGKVVVIYLQIHRGFDKKASKSCIPTTQEDYGRKKNTEKTRSGLCYATTFKEWTLTFDDAAAICLTDVCCHGY